MAMSTAKLCKPKSYSVYMGNRELDKFVCILDRTDGLAGDLSASLWGVFQTNRVLKKEIFHLFLLSILDIKTKHPYTLFSYRVPFSFSS